MGDIQAAPSNMRSRDIVTGVAFLLIGLAWAYLTAGLPARSLPNTPGPQFFPWVVTVAILVLSALLLMRTVWAGSEEGEAPPRKAGGAGIGVVAFVLACFAVYIWLLPVLGFLIATAPFFAILMVVFGERRPLVVLLGAPIATGVLYMLFRMGFQIILPQGVLTGIVP